MVGGVIIPDQGGREAVETVVYLVWDGGRMDDAAADLKHFMDVDEGAGHVEDVLEGSAVEDDVEAIVKRDDRVGLIQVEDVVGFVNRRRIAATNLVKSEH